jgi:hypothetical protein
MAAVDRVVHHCVIVDMMAVESYRAKEATISNQQTTTIWPDAEALRGRLEIHSTNATRLYRCRLLARVGSFLVLWWRQIAQHTLNRRPLDPSGAILSQVLNILA